MIRRSHQEHGQVPSGHQGVSQWPVALTQIQIRPEVGQLIKESAKTKLILYVNSIHHGFCQVFDLIQEAW